MSYREDNAPAGSGGYVFAGFLFLLFGSLLIFCDFFLLSFVLTSDAPSKVLGTVAIVTLFVIQIAGVWIFLIVPVSLVATAMVAFTLAARSFTATDKSAPVAVVAQQATQITLYLEYFPVTRTRWSGFWTDLRATMTSAMGWRLFVAIYALWLVPMTILLQRSLGAGTLPMVIVELAVAVVLIVWHRVRSGRILVKTRPPRLR